MDAGAVAPHFWGGLGGGVGDGDGGVGEGGVFGVFVYRVDAEAVDAAGEPEDHGVGVDFFAAGGVFPVEVGLGGVVEVEVVFLGVGVPGPGWAGEVAAPVCWGDAEAGGVESGGFPDVPVSLGVGFGGAGFEEPGVEGRGVVDYEVEDELHAAGVAGVDEGVDVGEGAVAGVDGLVVGDVVAHVFLGGFEHGREPDDVDAELVEVVDFGDEAGDVAPAVVVGVFEAGGVDLVEDCGFPPWLFAYPAVWVAVEGVHGDGWYGFRVRVSEVGDRGEGELWVYCLRERTGQFTLT